jgi:branched-chain amino acid transport system ATP-binding protein
MLEVEALEVWYGAAPALWGVSLTLRAGELLSVVGPNGAGKTTLVNALCGIERARAGTIVVDGVDVTRLPSHRFCAAGIAVVPEGRRLFGAMTVRENLELGSHLPRARAERAQSLAAALALARALMARPRLLLLDEPSLGLSPLIVEDMFDAVRRIHAQGVAVLLVEQNVEVALSLADRAYVLEEGRIVAEGDADELLARPEIQRAYLGV